MEFLMNSRSKIIVLSMFFMSMSASTFSMQTQADAKRAQQQLHQQARPSESKGALETVFTPVLWLLDNTISAVGRHVGSWVWDTDYTAFTRMRRLASIPCFGIATHQAFKAMQIGYRGRNMRISELGALLKPTGIAVGVGALGFMLIMDPTKAQNGART